MTIREELDHLKNSIINFSNAAENCEIIQINQYSELIGDSIRYLDYGRNIQFAEPKEERQVGEYRSLINQYEKAKDKLFRCDCQKS